MQLIATINPEQTTEQESKTYQIREAVRAVVTDEQNNLAILHVTNHQYYKLPGGGINPGENKLTALKRECLEEIGCEIEITAELGKIIEYRKMWQLQQISYCYLAKITGPKGLASFTKKELADGFQQLWLPYSDALSLVSTNQALNSEGKNYIVPRDTLILELAKKYF